MIKETPATVFSLLGAAMFSMFLLFAVSASNASFAGSEIALPDIAGPSAVVAMLDNVSSSYSSFVNANLLQPVEQSYAMVFDNVNFVIDEVSPTILAYTGLEALTEAHVAASQAEMVAGASTEVVYSSYYQESKSVFSIFYQ